MLNLRKSLLWGSLALSSAVAFAEEWNFVEGSSVEQVSNKNTTENSFEQMPKSERGSASNSMASLPQGDTISVTKQFTNLAPGYYDVTAVVTSSSASGACYLFGKGEGYTMGSTMIPIGDNLKVTVRGVGTTSGTLVAGIYSDGVHAVQVSDLQVTKSSAYNFLQGGDITELNYVLDYGGRYADDNGISLTPDGLSREEMAQNVINYLAGNGMNFVRIRLTNNPGQPDNSGQYYIPEGYQDESDCLQLAKMANEAGMDIQFTFNWSDFWSNGTQQDVPVDWLQAVKNAGSGNETSTLATCAYNYTKKVMQNLASLNIYPAYVSLGNETNGGFLFPYCYAYDVTSDNATTAMPVGSANWSAIAAVVNAGYKAVKEVSPNSQVVIHLADNTYDVVDKSDHVDWWVYSWYFDALKKAGANFDVIGASYYPSWSSATADQAAQFYATLINRYNKDILVMETGYNWTEKRKDGYDGQLPYNAEAYKTRYPFGKDGQKGFIADVLNELKGVAPSSQNHVIGDLYWDPMMIHVEDASGNNATGWANWYEWKTPDANVVENTTLFDFDGKALPSFDAYRYNRNSKPLQAYTVSVVNNTTADDSKLSTEKAFYGDSVSVSWQKQENTRVDSVIVRTDQSETVYRISDQDQQHLDVEMPDGDATFVVYRSELDRAFAPITEVENALVVTPINGGFTVHASVATEVNIYTALGTLYRTLTLTPNQSTAVSAPAGIYMVGNQKVVVK